MNVRRRNRIGSRINIVVTLIAMWFFLPDAARAQLGNSQVDTYGSHRVTHFLHNHNLPLVGAQIIDNDDGSRELHLYGFVATPFGMKDAQEKALKYLGDKTIKVVNAIQVNPSLANMPPSTPSPEMPEAAEAPMPAPALPGNPPISDNQAVPNYQTNSGSPANAGSQGNSNSQWDKAMGNILKNGAQPLPQPSVPQP